MKNMKSIPALAGWALGSIFIIIGWVVEKLSKVIIRLSEGLTSIISSADHKVKREHLRIIRSNPVNVTVQHNNA